MRPTTTDLMNCLRESGMSDEDARRVAEYIDKRVEEGLREAKEYTDRLCAEIDEKIKAQDAEIMARFDSVEKHLDRDRTLAAREDLHA